MSDATPPRPLPPPPDASAGWAREGAPATVAPVTNGMAISALITGLVGLALFWTVVPSLILGILAVVFGATGKGRANRGAPNGTMAIVGLVLGVIAIIGSLAMILVWMNVGTTTEVRIGEDVVEIGGLILRR